MFGANIIAGCVIMGHKFKKKEKRTITDTPLPLLVNP